MTHHGLHDLSNRSREVVLSPDEDGVRLALDVGQDVGAEVPRGADHVGEAHEEGAPCPTEDERADEGADKALHRLLGRKLDQRCTAEQLATDVGHDVVADNQRRGHKEPN